MDVILKDAWLVDIDPPRAERGDLHIRAGQVAARGRFDIPYGCDIVECGGAVVLPGLVNGHTHLYSALAVGMPPPAVAPQNFHEILERVWWCLDQALDPDTITLSATVGALDALRCGTTTLIDHHASPRAIAGALDRVEAGIDSVGLRGVLCYETTDRHGSAGREAGLAENERYLGLRHPGAHPRFAGLVGAHALFTLDDDTLRHLVALARSFTTGIHIHVAEDPCDEDLCARQHQVSLIDRLAGAGMLTADAVLAHCTHLDDGAIDRVNRARLTVAHNPRSNMNNEVGYAPIGRLTCPVMLGTDGIGSDLFNEARTAWFMARHEHAAVTPDDILAMLAAAARRASRALDTHLGSLAVGAAADIVVTDYRPATPLSDGNVAGHVLFGLNAHHVRHVLVGGDWVLRDRHVLQVEEQALREQAAGAAGRLWERMRSVAPDARAMK